MTSSGSDPDIKFSVVTPTGRGAVATIIVRGEGALLLVTRFFRSPGGNSIGRNYSGRVFYGNWQLDDQPGEDLIICPKSETLVEIHCHGGESATRAIGNSLVCSGAKNVDATDMAVLLYGSSYRADLFKAISMSQTQRTARFLLVQPANHLAFWEKVVAALKRADFESATKLIQSCQRWRLFGERLTTPWAVVFCGPPNVGKSSLINTLLGFQRAIVHEQAGTTRDVIAERTAIDGWPLRLFDTAGLRETRDEIERIGIEGARQTISDADLVILVVDATNDDRREMARLILKYTPAFVVANKSDLGHCRHASIDLQTSALTGTGIEQLAAKISQTLVPEIPVFEDTIPVAPSHNELLDAVCQMIDSEKPTDALDKAIKACRSLAPTNSR
jgi:tRNA modification GTPase